MNNQQAIDRLVKHLEWGWSPETVEAIKMGIHALEETQWIPCSERMPDDDDYRDYLVLVENHIEEAPMICQCNLEYGFGYYKDIYDPVTLGYFDTEFSTLDELGYEKAMYWMQMPEPPVEEEGV